MRPHLMGGQRAATPPPRDQQLRRRVSRLLHDLGLELLLASRALDGPEPVDAWTHLERIRALLQRRLPH